MAEMGVLEERRTAKGRLKCSLCLFTLRLASDCLQAPQLDDIVKKLEKREIVGELPSGGGDRDAASHLNVDQPPRRA